MYRIGGVLAFLLVLSGITAAQTGGQFCLRAYEDRNGNTVLDSGEPFLTGGVSANLLNADNLVVASALMDDSPNKAQGVICFQFLEAGQYSLLITSAEYAPTTPDTFTASVSAGTLPTVVEYGAQRISFEPTSSAPVTATASETQRDTLARIVLSGLGTLVVVAGMIIVGTFIYLLAFRQQPATPQMAVDPRQTPSSTDSISRVQVAVSDTNDDEETEGI